MYFANILKHENACKCRTSSHTDICEIWKMYYKTSYLKFLLTKPKKNHNFNAILRPPLAHNVINRSLYFILRNAILTYSVERHGKFLSKSHNSIVWSVP